MHLHLCARRHNQGVCHFLIHTLTCMPHARQQVEHAHEAGQFTGREFEKIIKEVDSSLTRLTDHG